MKKMMCLVLCLLLCLTGVLCASAEETASYQIEKPVQASDYEAWFAACANIITGESVEVTWVTEEGLDGLHQCLINGMNLGIFYIEEEGIVKTLAFTAMGDIDMISQMIPGQFVYAVSPLLTHDGADIANAAAKIQNELVNALFDGTMLGNKIDFCGLSAVALANVNEQQIFSFQVLLGLETAE